DLMRTRSWAWVLMLALGSCSKQAANPPGSPPAAEPAAAAPPSAAATAEATQIFSSRCTPCHGTQGGGDGPASKGLSPAPRNFQHPAWQASVDDKHIETIIKFGGASVGKSPAMPPNPDLMSKPEVVSALRAHVRSLVQK